MGKFEIVIKAMTFFLSFLIAVSGVQGQVTDLELSVVKDPDGPVFPGMRGTLTLTVRNLGPDPAGGTYGPVFVSSSNYATLDPNGTDPLIKFIDTPGNPCGLTYVLSFPPPDEPNPVIHYLFGFAGLDVGASQTCVIEFVVHDSLREDFEMSWSASSVFSSDPDPLNDLVFVAFPLAITAIPTLSHFSMALFAMSLMMGAFVLRRRASKLPGQSF